MRVSFCLFACFALMLLAAPPSQAQTEDKPVKVFILAGQSNMVGYGKSLNGLNPDYDPATDPGHLREIAGGIGSLTWAVNTMPERFGHGGTDPLVDSNGNWLVRDDVNVYARMDYFQGEPAGSGITRKGAHTIGFGKANSTTQKWNGPEYGFGHVVGNALDQDVLIIKVATGGTSLYEHWLSPTAATNRGRAEGYMWGHMVNTVNSVLENLETEFPDYAGQGYEIAGFGWHQGWNDGGSQAAVDEYAGNMADFIRDVRKQFGEEIPFVIANTGIGGEDLSGRRLELLEAQNTMADFEAYPEFEGNVAVVETRPMYRDSSESPSTFNYHWNHNGITYYEIGAGMGQAYLTLAPEPGSMCLLGVGGAMLMSRRTR